MRYVWSWQLFLPPRYISWHIFFWKVRPGRNFPACQAEHILYELQIKFSENKKLYFYYIILSLTVVGRKNRCIPYIYWAAAIFIVVSNYSNLFLPFAFFLDCSHFTLGYELIVRPEIAGFVKSIRNLFTKPAISGRTINS